MNVADLFKKRFFPDFALVAGNLGLSREITSVTVMDSPDIDKWLRGGEFMIGNGFMFKNNPEQFAPFLERVNAKNVAAVGMKFGRFHATLPQEAMLAAESMSLPVIEIPIVYRWTDILDIIYGVLLPIQKDPSFFTYWDSNWTIEKSFADLALALGRDFLLVCPHFGIDVTLFCATGGIQEGHTLYRLLMESSTAPLPSSASDSLPNQIIELGGDSTRRAIRYSMLFRNISADLYLILKSGEKLPSLRQERSIELVFLLLRAEHMERSAALKSRADRQKFFLEHLCTGIFYGDEEMMQFNAIRYEVKIDFPCQVLQTQNNASHSVRKIPGIKQNYDSKNICVGIFENGNIKETLHQYALGAGVHIVIGSVAHKYSEIAASYKNATHVFNLVREMHLPPGVYEHDQFALFDMLNKIGMSQGAQEIWRTYWYPLMETPSKRCLTLDQFATALVQSDYNLKKTADKLHIHYNTARKYFHRLESLLKMDLSRKTYRLSLNLAYHTHLAIHEKATLLEEIQLEAAIKY